MTPSTYFGSALRGACALGLTFAIWIYHFNPTDTLALNIVNYSPFMVALVALRLLYLFFRDGDTGNIKYRHVIKYWLSIFWILFAIALMFVSLSTLVQPPLSPKSPIPTWEDFKWLGPLAAPLYLIVMPLVLLSHLLDPRWLILTFAWFFLVVAILLLVPFGIKWRYHRTQLENSNLFSDRTKSMGILLILGTSLVSVTIGIFHAGGLL